jgi:uncharacterized membrane protein HdeD (DUF308 family)
MQRRDNDPAQQLDSLGRSWGWVLAFGLATLLIGILVVMDPSSSVVFVAVVIGIEFVLSGIFHIVASFTSVGEGHRVWMILIGILSIAVGVFLIRHLNITLSILPVIVGIFWIVQGVMEFFAAVANKEMVSRGWNMLLGVVILIAGIVVVSWPIHSIVALAWLTGLSLIFFGAMISMSAFQVKKFAGRAGTPA